MNDFEWDIPKMPDPIQLEYDLIVPVVGEYSEKLGYLNQLIGVGDVIGIFDEDLQEFTLELLYDENLYLKTLSNLGNFKRLKSGDELCKICNVCL